MFNFTLRKATAGFGNIIAVKHAIIVEALSGDNFWRAQILRILQLQIRD